MRPCFIMGNVNFPIEIDALRAPGMYWLAMDREQDVMFTCRQILLAQPLQSRVLWLGDGTSASTHAASLGSESGPGKLLLAGYEPVSLGRHLQRLPDELTRRLPRRRGQPWLVLLTLPSAILDTRSAQRLGEYFLAWNAWAHREQVALLVISHGTQAAALCDRLQPLNDALDGLAYLQCLSDTFRYRLLHWRNDHGQHIEQEIPLARDENGWCASVSMPLQLSWQDDEQQVLVESACLPFSLPLPDRWQLFESPETLVAEALKAYAATVIFAVKISDDIESVARYLHSLRRQRGTTIKLVVRGLSPCLRLHNEQLLLACGANLVSTQDIDDRRFLRQLAALQGQRIQRHVPESFEVLLQASHPPADRGIMSPQRFVTSLRSHMRDQPPELSGQLMVILHPGHGLTASEALERCRIRRQGDMVTVLEETLYLFLFGCQVQEVDQVLLRLFGVPSGELFISRALLPTPETMLPVLQELAARPLSDEVPTLPIFFQDEDGTKPAKGYADYHRPQAPPSPLVKQVRLCLANSHAERL